MFITFWGPWGKFNMQKDEYTEYIHNCWHEWFLKISYITYHYLIFDLKIPQQKATF